MSILPWQIVSFILIDCESIFPNIQHVNFILTDCQFYPNGLHVHFPLKYGMSILPRQPANLFNTNRLYVSFTHIEWMSVLL